MTGSVCFVELPTQTEKEICIAPQINGLTTGQWS